MKYDGLSQWFRFKENGALDTDEYKYYVFKEDGYSDTVKLEGLGEL